MAYQRYFPASDGDQVQWLTNFLAKFAGYSAQLEISAGQVTSLTADIVYAIWTLEHWVPAWRSYSKSATSFREMMAAGKGSGTLSAPPVPTFTGDAAQPPGVPPGALKRIFKSVARWKTAPGYHAAIGKDLGIEVPAKADGPPAPAVSGRTEAGKPRLSFVKGRHKGVYIESRRAGEPAFAFLAVSTKKPYVDSRPLAVPGQPEWREYRLQFWDGAPGDPKRESSEIVRALAGE